jgi:hypothetical protein
MTKLSSKIKPNLLTIITYDNQQYYAAGFVILIIDILVIYNTEFLFWPMFILIGLGVLLFKRFQDFTPLLTQIAPVNSKEYYFLFSKLIHNRIDDKNYLENFLLDFKNDEDWKRTFKMIPVEMFPDMDSPHLGGRSGRILQEKHSEICRNITTSGVGEFRLMFLQLEHTSLMADFAMSAAKREFQENERVAESQVIRGIAVFSSIGNYDTHYYNVICGSCDNEMFEKVSFVVGPNACKLPYKYPSLVKCSDCKAKNKIVCS